MALWSAEEKFDSTIWGPEPRTRKMFQPAGPAKMVLGPGPCRWIDPLDAGCLSPLKHRPASPRNLRGEAATPIDTPIPLPELQFQLNISNRVYEAWLDLPTPNVSPRDAGVLSPHFPPPGETDVVVPQSVKLGVGGALSLTL